MMGIRSPKSSGNRLKRKGVRLAGDSEPRTLTTHTTVYAFIQMTVSPKDKATRKYMELLLA